MANYGKIISLIGTIVNSSAFIYYYFTESFNFGWLVASIWSLSSYFCELNLSIREKQVKNLLEELKK